MKLEAMNISFQYDNGNRKILNNVSISLESGERVGLTAPSGFGKTTFCKILAGYEKPDHGTVVLDGKNISSCAGYNPVQMIWQHPGPSPMRRICPRDVPMGPAARIWTRAVFRKFPIAVFAAAW